MSLIEAPTKNKQSISSGLSKFGFFAFFGTMLAILAALLAPVSGVSAAARGTAAAHPGAPQFASLISFQAKQGKSKTVQLRWQTASELNLQGFYVWKCTANGEWTRLTVQMIPTQNPGSLQGAKYVVHDSKVRTGKVLYYHLEIVDFNGNSSWTPDVSLKIK